MTSPPPSFTPIMASPSPSPIMASSSPSPPTVLRRRWSNSSKKRLNPSFSELPLCLLEIIMSHLVLKDNIRASAVCKSWREAALSVRVVEKHPWLMCFPKRGGSVIKLHDPLECKSYTLNLPEIAKSKVCYSRDGWLLMHRSSSSEVFFFNPFSRELISLPKLELPFQKIAFSCPPTSDNCVVIALNFAAQDAYLDRRMSSITCHPGATEWISKESYGDFEPFDTHMKIVYHNDRFYYFGGGYLYSFHLSSRTWYFQDAIYIFQPHQLMWEEKPVFLAVKEGELFLMFISSNGKPMVYKLVSYQWKEVSGINLDGLTIFVSFHNSEMRSNLPWIRNNFYFSRFGYNRKRCVSYSFDENRYSTRKEWQDDWLELCPPHNLWIDPPNNVLDYL